MHFLVLYLVSSSQTIIDFTAFIIVNCFKPISDSHAESLPDKNQKEKKKKKKYDKEINIGKFDWNLCT